VRGRLLRGRWKLALLTVFSAGTLMLAGGCDAPASADLPGSQWPAGASGRLCQVIEYDKVAATLGVRFDTAGGGHQDDTITCALTRAGHDFPYLTLAAAPTAVDNLVFVATVRPTGAEQLNGLGASAYQLAVAPADGSGGGLEIGWLSPSHRLLTLRYIFAPDATPADVAALTPKLVALAGQIETAMLATTAPLTTSSPSPPASQG
jgi:hypothetical protein